MPHSWLRERRHSLLVSSVALLTLVPWQLFLAMGFTFTFREHEPAILWAFVAFLFLLDIPAVLLSFFFPRFAMWWMAANVVGAVVSWYFVAGREVRWSQPGFGGWQMQTDNAGQLLAVFSPKAAFFLALRWANRRMEPISLTA